MNDWTKWPRIPNYSDYDFKEDYADDIEDYEEDLRKRQKEHLRRVNENNGWRSCLHDGCSDCVGTGIKRDGSLCFHMLSCPCPKCSPRC